MSFANDSLEENWNYTAMTTPKALWLVQQKSLYTISSLNRCANNYIPAQCV